MEDLNVYVTALEGASSLIPEVQWKAGLKGLFGLVSYEEHGDDTARGVWYSTTPEALAIPGGLTAVVPSAEEHYCADRAIMSSLVRSAIRPDNCIEFARVLLERNPHTSKAKSDLQAVWLAVESEVQSAQ